MDLTQAMFAATQDPPPTSIDVDQLITRERRRTRRLAAVTTAAGVAALLAGVVAVPQLLSRTPSGQSPGLTPPGCVTLTFPPARSGAPEPMPTELRPGPPRVPVTESCAAASTRLGTELTRQLPDAVLNDRVFKDPREEVGYQATFNLLDGQMTVRLWAGEETPAQFRASVDGRCRPPVDPVCRGDAIGGTELMIQSLGPPGIVVVLAVRPDGTTLSANYWGNGPLPVVEQQIIQLMTAPGLTLYP